MSPHLRRHAISAAFAIISLYLPILFQLLVDHGRWETGDLTFWLLAAPGFAPVVFLIFQDIIPDLGSETAYLAIGVVMTLLFVAGLTLLGARNRLWQIAAIILGSALGGFSAWIGWALSRME
ncbi:MAG: hypothetical protein KDN19_23195 [Verrucomicrobiae bacterium]|nr:hypothetical protein [Verrucomicrobiae bacterium]